MPYARRPRSQPVPVVLGLVLTVIGLAVAGVVLGFALLSPPPGRTTLPPLRAATAAADQAPSQAIATMPTLEVVKSPTCACCAKWIDHAREAGFTVNVRDVLTLAPTKRQLGVPAEATSCHTTTAGGYAFEGHVPADLVARVLAERPDIAGLAAPGMPQSAPGMDAGGPHEPHEVVQFTRDGRMTPYAMR